MAQVALTNIKHNTTFIEAGTEINEETLPDATEEEIEALVESGAIGEPTLTGAEAEVYAQQRLAEVDELLQQKYGLSLNEVLATEDTAGESTPAVRADGSPEGEGSPDGV
jgi:hypothetical protein